MLRSTRWRETDRRTLVSSGAKWGRCETYIRSALAMGLVHGQHCTDSPDIRKGPSADLSQPEAGVGEGDSKHCL